MSGVSERQRGRLKESFRERLDHGTDWQKCCDRARQEVIDFLDLGPDEAEQLVDQISDEVLGELAQFYEVDAAILAESGWSPWYTGPRTDDVCWPGYKSRLLDEKGWNSEAVDSIDRMSSAIVGRINPPGRGKGSCHGLVVGYIQSGKTSNLTAVIAKAVDRGYKLVIVLAGLTDVLRNQTQGRLEDDLIDKSRDHWDRLTRRDADFDVGGRTNLVVPRNAAYLAVVKKNTHVLAKLRDVLDNTSSAHRQNLPALIVDDETDQASPDVSRVDESTDPSTINKRIREILARLPSYSYIGYTATPFANVLINPAASVDQEDLGSDIYPRDFIVSLPRPPEYFGPEELFGRDLVSADDPGPQHGGLDMIRHIPGTELERVRELEDSGPAGGDDIPESLTEAVLWYVLASSVWLVRGHSGHSTMMVHTSMLTDAHSGVAATLRNELERLRKEAERTVRSKMESLWLREQGAVDPAEFGHERLEFDTVYGMAQEVLEKVRVHEDNYVADQTVDLSEEAPAQCAIIVGGNRLSRGVTLPRLLVSYFARKSHQYDTLLQMGRWFGYRGGYDDLPRVWMTAEAAAAFRELATIEAEIREDIAVYADGDMRPIDWGIRIRQVPGMLVTRRAAMQSAIRCNLTYSGEHLQTIRFYHHDRSWLETNWDAGSQLINWTHSEADQHQSMEGADVFYGVDVDAILEFLQMYQTTSEQKRTDTGQLRQYIRQYADEELATWNVAVARTRDGEQSERVLGQLGRVPTVVRSRLKDAPDDVADIKALMSKADVFMDVDERPAGVSSEGWKRLKLMRKEWQGRDHRPLLILYPINRTSPPRQPGRDRVALDAATDVLGMGIVFPEDPVGYQGHYVTVDLSAVRESDEEEP